jgi:hypothetical protein
LPRARQNHARSRCESASAPKDERACRFTRKWTRAGRFMSTRPRQKWPPSKRRCSTMNSLLVILALKCLVEYFIDSRTRSCAATIADTHRDGNPAGNTADVAPLTKSNVYLALVDVSFPTEFANRRFFFSWHSRVQSPPVSPMEVTLHHLALIVCELPHTHPLSFSSRGHRVQSC